MACEKYYQSPRISSEFKDCSLPLTFDQYNICGYGVGKNCVGCLYCALKGSKILMKNGCYKKIEKIKKEEQVVTINISNNFKREISEVKTTMNRTVKEIYEIGAYSKIYLTGEHPVYTKRGWIKVKDLTTEDYILWFNHIKIYNKNNPKFHLKISKRLKINNPMKKKKNIKKMLKTRKIGNWKQSLFGRKRPDMRNKMLNPLSNPMKNPEISCQVLQKARNSLKQNGASAGEKILYNLLNDMGIKYEKEYLVKSDKSYYYLDVSLSKFKIDIEYDGCYFHDYFPEKDQKRDKYLKSLGWKILRIKRNEIFVKDFIRKKIENFLKKNTHNDFYYWAKIKKIKIKKGNFHVYNIETNPNNNYILSGKLVHNCFSNTERITNPAYKGKFELKKLNTEKFIEEVSGKRPNPYYDNFYKYRFPLHWGGLSEPFCPLERKNKVGLEILKYLSSIEYPLIFSTKGIFQCYEKEYLDIWKKYQKSKNVGFSFSIITNSDETAKKIEVHVPPTTERLKAMKVLSDMGFWTVLRLRPFFIGITDIGLEELLERAKNSGAKAISTEFYCLDARSLKDTIERVKEMSNICGIDIEQYYRTLSPSERGTYWRLNKLVKEYYMRRLFIKCKELNLKVSISDPDFKEFNWSGNCCGYPQDRTIYDSEICNSSKGQLTHHIIELRKRYWISECKDKYLTWEQVYKSISNHWMDEPKYFNDSIKYWLTNYHKKEEGHRYEFLQSWNSLTSSDAPYNYFMGVLKPSYTDDKGNIVYEYNPSQSEIRMKQEGIV